MTCMFHPLHTHLGTASVSGANIPFIVLSSDSSRGDINGLPREMSVRFGGWYNSFSGWQTHYTPGDEPMGQVTYNESTCQWTGAGFTFNIGCPDRLLDTDWDGLAWYVDIPEKIAYSVGTHQAGYLYSRHVASQQLCGYYGSPGEPRIRWVAAAAMNPSTANLPALFHIPTPGCPEPRFIGPSARYPFYSEEDGTYTHEPFHRCFEGNIVLFGDAFRGVSSGPVDFNVWSEDYGLFETLPEWWYASPTTMSIEGFSADIHVFDTDLSLEYSGTVTRPHYGQPDYINAENLYKWFPILTGYRDIGDVEPIIVNGAGGSGMLRKLITASANRVTIFLSFKPDLVLFPQVALAIFVYDNKKIVDDDPMYYRFQQTETFVYNAEGSGFADILSKSDSISVSV
jgi:hypothetical protein